MRSGARPFDTEHSVATEETNVNLGYRYRVCEVSYVTQSCSFDVRRLVSVSPEFFDQGWAYLCAKSDLSEDNEVETYPIFGGLA